MKKLNCVVVDDEPLAVKIIENFIQSTDFLTLQASFTDAIAAMEEIRQSPPHVLFLDIQMPDVDGMTLASLVPPATRIIFTTAFKEFAFDSYEVNALDFLLKPIRYNKFVAAADKAKAWFERQEQKTTAQVAAHLYLRIDGELRQVRLSDILYVNGMKDYVMFWLQNEKRPLVTHLTMKAVEDMLPAASFMRVHRSYIVALDKISRIDRNNCIYIGNEVIHVSESCLEAFRQYVNAHLPQS